MTKKKAQKIFIPIGLAVALIAFGLIYYFSRRIPTNPADASGNTTGNLINGGTFCETNGRIYFSNPYDLGRLYAMDSDCSNIEKLNDDTVSYINSYGNYVYYVRKNGDGSASSVLFRGELYGVVRIKLDGSKEKTLYTGYSTDLHMVANTLVFNANNQSVLSTMTTGLDGGTPNILYNGNITTASIDNGSIFYSNNEGNHCVYILSVDNGNRTLYLDGNTYMASVENNVLYYIDLDNHNALTSIDLSTYTKKLISGDHVVSYNIYNDVIFYQTENTSDYHALKRMNLDGSDAVEIVKGDATQINCTSQYTFFHLFDDDNLYRVATHGGTKVEKFIITYQ